MINFEYKTWICGSMLMSCPSSCISTKTNTSHFLLCVRSLQTNSEAWCCWTEIQHAVQTGDWNAAYHKWNRNPLSWMAQLSWPVCLCLCTSVQNYALGCYQLGPCHVSEGALYRELSLSVLVRGLWKTWHCSEEMSYCRGPTVTNKARPTTPATAFCHPSPDL